jgi:uncharacterized protein (TIGR02594 family)
MSFFDINKLTSNDTFSNTLANKKAETFEEMLSAKVESQLWCLGLGGTLSYYTDINGVLERIPNVDVSNLGVGNDGNNVNTDTSNGVVYNSVTGDPTWLAVAFKELGVQEVPGKGTAFSNPRIGEYLKVVGKISADNIPWCSAFTNWCMTQVRIKPSGSAMARSWLKWGVPTSFKRGAIVVLQTSPPPHGHVGFALEETSSHIKVLGGNQSDKVMIKDYKKSLLIEYRWPSPN